MQEVGYKSWGLIPVDSDPSSTMPTSDHPPMISTFALDRGASLVIELAEPLEEVHLRMRVTALSTESESGSNLKLLSGRSEVLEPLIAEEWEKSFESMDAVFTIRLQTIGPYLKIHSQAKGTLIIITVNLSVSQ
jgi:hypothetical protein